jgi:hypothetical protein
MMQLPAADAPEERLAASQLSANSLAVFVPAPLPKAGTVDIVRLIVFEASAFDEAIANMWVSKGGDRRCQGATNEMLVK